MTEEIVKIENCRVAMKAALEAIQDYCGMAPNTGEPEHGRYIKFAGDIIEYPIGVHDIMADPELSGEEQIEKMSDTPWAEQNAIRLCNDMFEDDGPLEIDACIKRLKHDLASAAVFQRLKWIKKY